MPFNNLNAHHIRLNTHQLQSLGNAPEGNICYDGLEGEMAEGFTTLTQILISVLDETRHADARLALRKFSEHMSTNVLTHSFSSIAMSQEVPQIYERLQRLSDLMGEESLSLKARQAVIENLSAGLNACLTTVALDFETAIRELSKKPGLTQKFADTLSSHIEAAILKTLPTSKEFENARTISLATTVYNLVAPNFGLSQKLDIAWQVESQERLLEWTARVIESVEIEDVIKALSSDFIGRVYTFLHEKFEFLDPRAIEEHEAGEVYSSYKNELQPLLAHEYLNIEPGEIFSTMSTNSTLACVADPMALEKIISKELMNLDLIEPFRPAKLVSLDFNGYKYKVKLIGDSIFYVSKRNLSLPRDKKSITINNFAHDDHLAAKALLDKISRVKTEGQESTIVKNQLGPALEAARISTLTKKLEAAIKADNLIDFFECIQAGAGSDSTAALEFAIRKDQPYLILQLLLGRHKNLYENFGIGHTPLMAAMYMGLKSDVTDYIAKSRTCDLEERDNKGMTAIIHAGMTGRITDIFNLSKLGANLNARDSYGKGAFFHALNSRKFNAALTLSINGADPDVLCGSSFNAVFATESLNIKDYETIVSLQPDLNPPETRRGPWLNLEVRIHRRAEVEVLLKYGADVNSRDAQGMTPIMIAAKESQLDIIEILHQYHALVNLRSNCGYNALNYAICARNEPAVEFLLNVGVEIDAPDFGLKESAISTAMTLGTPEIAEMIERHRTSIVRQFQEPA